MMNLSITPEGGSVLERIAAALEKIAEGCGPREVCTNSEGVTVTPVHIGVPAEPGAGGPDGEDQTELERALSEQPTVLLTPSAPALSDAALDTLEHAMFDAVAAPEPPEMPAPTLDAIRQKVIRLSAAGKKDAAREIVLSVAPCVREIPPEHFVSVWEKLTALEG